VKKWWKSDLISCFAQHHNDFIVISEEDVIDVDKVEQIETAILEHNQEIYDHLEKEMLEHWKERERIGQICCDRQKRKFVLDKFKKSLSNHPKKILTVDDLKGMKFIGIVAKSKVICLNCLKMIFVFVKLQMHTHAHTHIHTHTHT
jgi:hypothetical protein